MRTRCFSEEVTERFAPGGDSRGAACGTLSFKGRLGKTVIQTDSCAGHHK